MLRKSTNSLSLPLGFRCAKIGLAYLEKGSVVIMPYQCMRASSTVRSSLRSVLVDFACTPVCHLVELG